MNVSKWFVRFMYAPSRMTQVFYPVMKHKCKPALIAFLALMALVEGDK